MTIKAVLFDMGGTLIKPDVVHQGEVFQRILNSLCIFKSLDEVKMAISNAEKEAEDTNLLSLFGKMQQEDYWRKWDALVLKHLGIEENEELARTVQSEWFDFMSFTLYPESRTVLRELRKRGLVLGLISTAYEEEIRFILEKVKLEEIAFDLIVGVDTVQRMKPHPEIFKHALKELKVKPEETMFVGDSVEADYKGAENVGIHALLVDRTGKKKQSEFETIKNLNEILSQID